MDYNKVLINLIEDKKSLIMNNNEEYCRYMLLLNKLDSVLLDFNNISKIDSSELELFNNPIAARYIAGIEYFSKLDSVDKTELLVKVEELKNMLLLAMNNNEVIKKLQNDLSDLDLLYNKLNNNEFDAELLFEFIKNCYNDKLIDIKTAIELNLYVAYESSNKVYNDVEDDVVVLSENEVSILDELRTTFSLYGYDYDNMKLSKKIREKLEKYARIDYLDFVLSILKDNNITVSDFEDRHGVICDIIIYNDREALIGIDNFVKSNNCSLSDLLGMGGIFHKRQRKFKFKGKGYIDGPTNNGETIPGEYDSFMKNIEIYKKLNNLPSDHKMTSIDFENRTIFFTTPHIKILRNLSILTAYGVLENGRLSGAISCLVGSNLEYLLDRCIESGLFDYCRKNLSFLELDSKEFRWYKIKRAIDLGDGLIRGKGLKRELKLERAYGGIKLIPKDGNMVIEQEPINSDKMASLGKDVCSSLFKKFAEDPNCDIDKLRFELFYKYRTFDIFDLFKRTNINFSKLSLIRANFYRKVDIDSSFLKQSDDQYIKLLDEAILCDNNGQLYNCMVDDKTYQIVSDAYPGIKVLISRYKVLQLVKILKEEQLWINDTFSDLDKENLLLSVLLKDTIVSDMEMQAVRITVRNILNGELKKNIIERRGVGK